MPSVTRRSQSNRAQRRDELRNQLLAAIEQMVSDGESFTEISVERLVAATGISRSTFYVYFEDKGELLRAWFAGIIEELDQAASQWWSLGAGATREELREALATVVESYRPHTPLMAAAADAAAYDTAVRAEFEAMMTRNTAGLARHIKRGQASGSVSSSLNPRETAAWLTWMAERGFHQLVRGQDDARVGKLIDSYTDIVWNTLYAPTRTALPS